MATQCPKCNSENPDTKQFCGDCGTQLIPSKDIPAQTRTLITPPQELSRGTIIAGRYEIIERLGTGGMGSVYRVEDTKIHEDVAIKLINPEIAADKRTIERFSNELKVARKIAHRNVCKMYDIGESKGTHFITMEYIPGEDLKSFMRRAKQLSIPTVVSIAKQICGGLDEAHKLGIVHRDLKPSNIMIDKDGNVHIMDFGIARSVKTEGITGTGVMIGTPEYMSPEQVESKEVDQLSDLYSLGVILYEMVTGRVPFEGETALSIARMHADKTPPDPKSINPQISDDLSHLILRCLEKDKENRYQSAGEIQSELENIEKGIPSPEEVLSKRKSITSKEITVTFGLRKLINPALIVIVIVVIAVVTWQFLFRKQPVAQPSTIPSVAVLLLDDLSPQKDQGYLCAGMAESIINALSKIKDLHVPAPTSSFSFRTQKIDVKEVGEKLNVKAVLRGSVQKAGNRIRITVQLINITDESLLWSEQYNREYEDIFAIQDEITLAIMDKLQVNLLGEKKESIVKHYTENLEAYNLYWQGRFFYNKKEKKSLEKALEYFQMALEIDPQFLLPYVGIADTFCSLGQFLYIPPDEAYPKAMDAVKKALEMDDTLYEAYATLGHINNYYNWDWTAAESNFNRAFELNKNYAYTHYRYIYFLIANGRLEEGLITAKRALELDPLSISINVNLGMAYLYNRQYDEAVEQFHKTLEMDPSYIVGYIWLGNVFGIKGMYEEAIESLQKVLTVHGDEVYALSHLGWVYALSGERDAALEVLNRLNGLQKEKYVSPWARAMIYIELGDNDKAFEYLEKSRMNREPLFMVSLHGPWYDKIRSDPRFKALLKKMNLE